MCSPQVLAKADIPEDGQRTRLRLLSPIEESKQHDGETRFIHNLALGEWVEF